MNKVRVIYHGRRFPRTVSIRGGVKRSFHPDKKVLALEEYDAMLLLKNNIRLTPDTWEFTVEGVDEDRAEKLPGGWTDKPKPAEEAPESKEKKAKSIKK